MGMIDALVLGLIQGLTEFLPISSSAHLRIAGIFLEGGRDPGAAFTAIIQLGTETAVLVYFRRDIVRIVRAFVLGLIGTKGADGQPRVPRTDHDYRMGWLIIIGSLPIVILGVLLQNLIENQFRSLWIIAFTMIVFGVLLGVVDHLGRKQKTIEDLGVRDGVIFGVAQALALIPGVSRSGGTITAGRFLGYTRGAAAHYSFLLAVPAVLGSGLYQTYDSLDGGVAWGPTLLATLIAFLVGFAVIAWLLRYLERGTFTPFVVYRVVLGLVLLALVGAGVLDPS